MILRHTNPTEVDTVMAIIDHGKAYLKSQNIDQWQNGYPNHQTILEDIKAGLAYVLEHQGEIVATAMISFENEPTYTDIKGTGWLTSNPYAVLHRVAVTPNLKGQGIGVALFDQVAKLCRQKGIKSIRIDTHEHNESMKNLLKKTAFTYCGIIYLDPDAAGDQGSRIAFEKVLA